jgi:hypothetical protein
MRSIPSTLAKRERGIGSPAPSPWESRDIASISLRTLSSPRPRLREKGIRWGGGGFFVRFINMSQFISPSHIPPLERSIARRQTQNQFTQTQKSEIRGLSFRHLLRRTRSPHPPSKAGHGAAIRGEAFPFAEFPRGGSHRKSWLGVGFKKVDRGRSQGDGAAAAEVRGCQMIDTDKVSPYLKEKHQGHLISWNEWTMSHGEMIPDLGSGVGALSDGSWTLCSPTDLATFNTTLPIHSVIFTLISYRQGAEKSPSGKHRDPTPRNI